MYHIRFTEVREAEGEKCQSIEQFQWRVSVFGITDKHRTGKSKPEATLDEIDPMIRLSIPIRTRIIGPPSVKPQKVDKSPHGRDYRV